MSGRVFFGTTKISRIFKGDTRIKRLYLSDLDKTITLGDKIDYSTPTLYPYPGDEDVYEDNDLFIFFKDSSTVDIGSFTATIKKGSETIETINATFQSEDISTEYMDNEVSLKDNYKIGSISGSAEQSGRTLNVGVQKLKFGTNSCYSDTIKYLRIKPSKPFDNNAEYTVEISGIDIGGEDNFNTYFGIDSWKFFTRSKHTIKNGTIYVSNNLNDYDADYRTLQGALKYINENPDDDYTVTVDGTTDMPYYELLYLNNKGKVVIQAKNNVNTDKNTGLVSCGNEIGYIKNINSKHNVSDASYRKPVIKFSNCGYLNELMTERGLFEFDGSGTLVLNNLRFINTYRRKLYNNGAGSYYAGEAFGMGGTGNFIARDCEFSSKQDTLMLLNKCWLYNCLIIGDVDYLWGYEGLKAALIEKSVLRCYCDNDRLSLESKSDTQSCIMAPRQSKDLFVGKGIVLLDDDIYIDNKTKSYYGRNPWDDDFINNGAVINCNIISEDKSVTHDGTYTGANSWFRSALWLSAGNDEGYSQLGFKDYNTIQNDSSDEAIETSAIRRYIKYVYYKQDKNYSYKQINFSVKFNFNQFTFNNTTFTDTSNDGRLGIAALALKNVVLVENSATNGTKVSYSDAGCNFKFTVCVPFYSIKSGTCTYNKNDYNNYKRSYSAYNSYSYYKGYKMTGISTVNYYSSDPGTYYTQAVKNEAIDNDGQMLYSFATDAKDLTFGTFNSNPVQNVNINFGGNIIKKDYVKAGEQLTWPSSTTIDIVSANQGGNAIYGYNERTANWVRTYFIPESAGSYNPRSQFWFYGTITYPESIGGSTTYNKYFWKRACNNAVVYNFVKNYRIYEGTETEDEEADLGSSNIYPDYTLYGSKVYSSGATDTVDSQELEVDAGNEYLVSTTTKIINGQSYLREKWIKYDYAEDLRCSGTEEISEDYYTAEYSTRDKILNRVFDLRNSTASIVKDKDVWTEYNDYISTADAAVDGNAPSNISIIEFSKMNSSTTYEGKTGILSSTYVSNYTGVTYTVDATSGKFYRNKTYGVFNSGTKLTISGASGKTLYVSTYLNDYANISYTDGSSTGTFANNPQRLSISSDSLVLSFTNTTNINSIYIY